MNDITLKAIEAVNESELAYCKFISANDAGSTGGHQSGFYIPHNSYSLLFETPGKPGSNKDRFIKIKWQDDFETDSRFIYYGTGTRNEYRLTRFGRGFPFQEDDNVGDLLIICRMSEDYYLAFVLSADEEIENFLAAFGISASETNKLIPKDTSLSIEQRLQILINQYIASLTVDFPLSNEVSSAARQIFLDLISVESFNEAIDPDTNLVSWLDIEFQLFKSLENSRYGSVIKNPFDSVESLVKFANTILNRRKSRAGKALENHLESMFQIFNLSYSAQPITEGRKKPDFIFPGETEYQASSFDSSKLVFLGAKTTCKDRWRQIINEAERIPTKHLFTLQQGISSNQLREMKEHNIVLVVPKAYKSSFPREFRSDILTLNTFISFVQETQSK